MSLQYLLDTNVCIGYLTCRSQSVYNRILATPRQTVAICDCASVYNVRERRSAPMIYKLRRSRWCMI